MSNRRNEGEVRNVRILISDLVKALEIVEMDMVIASGSMYATIEADENTIKALNDHGIFWTFD